MQCENLAFAAIFKACFHLDLWVKCENNNTKSNLEKLGHFRTTFRIQIKTISQREHKILLLIGLKTMHTWTKPNVNTLAKGFTEVKQQHQSKFMAKIPNLDIV